MINSNDGGGNVSVNGGQTWTGQQFATAQLYHVAVTRDIPYHVCGAQQDSSTICASSAAAADAAGRRAAAQHLQRGRRRERLHRARPAQRQHLLRRQPGRAAHALRPPHQLQPRRAGVPAVLLGRECRFSAGALAVDLPHRLFASESRISYTRRRSTCGRPWTKATHGRAFRTDLTRADPKTLGDSGGPITHDQNGPEIYGTIFTIAP